MPTPRAVEVTYTLEIEPEDQPVRGNLRCGDPSMEAEDIALEDSIIARLDRGEIEAWCVVVVTASITVDGQTFKGRDSMGGVSYESERALRKDLFEDDSHGMKNGALENLKANLAEIVSRAAVARKALKCLAR